MAIGAGGNEHLPTVVAQPGEIGAVLPGQLVRLTEILHDAVRVLHPVAVVRELEFRRFVTAFRLAVALA